MKLAPNPVTAREVAESLAGVAEAVDLMDQVGVIADKAGDSGRQIRRRLR